MGEDAVQRRAERAERADYHVEAQRRRSEQESAKAQVLVDRFVAQATQEGLATEELTARPWSGRGRYRTGVVGWYLRRDRSIGVGLDGSYYVLVVAPERFGRWRTVPGRPDPSAAPGRAGCPRRRVHRPEEAAGTAAAVVGLHRGLSARPAPLHTPCLALRAASRMWQRPNWQSDNGLAPSDWPRLREAVREALAGPLAGNAARALALFTHELVDAAAGPGHPHFRRVKGRPVDLTGGSSGWLLRCTTVRRSGLMAAGGSGRAWRRCARAGEGRRSLGRHVAAGWPDFTAAALRPEVRDFYEHTSEWRMEVWTQWNALFQPGGDPSPSRSRTAKRARGIPP